MGYKYSLKNIFMGNGYCNDGDYVYRIIEISSFR